MKAYAFTQDIIDNLSALEKKGFDVRQFNQFMEEWVNEKQTP
jgi:ATP-dependent exoDNAse (exonuclease V) alpha subunit